MLSAMFILPIFSDFNNIYSNINLVERQTCSPENSSVKGQFLDIGELTCRPDTPPLPEDDPQWAEET